MAKRNSPKVNPIRTLRELGELVERDEGTVSRWCKRDDWPFARKAPWARSQVPKILRWVADVLGREEQSVADGDEMGELRKEKLRQEIRHLIARAETAETALAKERGRLIEAAEVEREWPAVGNVVRNGFANLTPRLVALALNKGLPQEAAAEFGALAEAEVAAILRKLSKDGAQDDV